MTNITLPRAELQQVLEAMENFGTDWDGWHRAYMALRERLAQPEQPNRDYWEEEARRYAGNADYWRGVAKRLKQPLQGEARMGTLRDLLMESYDRGVADTLESCREAALQSVEAEIKAEREACAQVGMLKAVNGIEVSAAIRARGNT